MASDRSDAWILVQLTMLLQLQAQLADEKCFKLGEVILLGFLISILLSLLCRLWQGSHPPSQLLNSIINWLFNRSIPNSIVFLTVIRHFFKAPICSWALNLWQTYLFHPSMNLHSIFWLVLEIRNGFDWSQIWIFQRGIQGGGLNVCDALALRVIILAANTRPNGG